MLSLIEVIKFDTISRNKRTPFTVSSRAGISREKRCSCPPIRQASNAAMAFIIMRTVSFGFLGDLNSMRLMASKRPDRQMETSGNEYAQKTEEKSSIPRIKPFVFQIEIRDKDGKINKTANPKSASV